MRTAQVFLQYVDWLGEGDTTRSEAADNFGVSKTTAAYHLERGIAEGYLERFYSWCKGQQTGWAYRKRGGQKSLDNEQLEYERAMDNETEQWLEEQHRAQLDAGIETPIL